MCCGLRSARKKPQNWLVLRLHSLSEFASFLGDDFADLHLGVDLTVAGLGAAVLAAAELLDDQLLATFDTNDFGLDRGTVDDRLTNLDAVFAGNQQNLVERQRVACGSANAEIDPQFLALFDFDLLAVFLNDRVHPIESNRVSIFQNGPRWGEWVQGKPHNLPARSLIVEGAAADFLGLSGPHRLLLFALLLGQKRSGELLKA